MDPGLDYRIIFGLSLRALGDILLVRSSVNQPSGDTVGAAFR
jgi:hypothetical protein